MSGWAFLSETSLSGGGSVSALGASSTSVGSSAAGSSVSGSGSLSTISISSGSFALGSMIWTFTPMTPSLTLAMANPSLIQSCLGSPQNLMCPALNFSILCRWPVILPEMTTRHPLAPDPIILLTVEWPALLKCQPLSRALASFSAMICELRLAFSTSWTSIWGFSNPNFASTA